MSDEEYIQPAEPWVRDQLATIDETGTTDSVGVAGLAVVVVTMRGAKSHKLRRVPLMRVEHDGAYAAVASKGGAPKNPVWVANLEADAAVEIQDGAAYHSATARLLEGPEREQWWERSVAAFPPYAEYQTKTDRQIPIYLLEPR